MSVAISHARPRGTTKETSRLLDSLSLLLGGLGLLLWIVAARDANFSHMSSYGLVSLLHWTYFLGLALVVGAFCLELTRSPLRSWRLLLLIVVLVLFLFGTASAIEPVAELPDSWIHAGFIQYIFAHGQPLEGYDARFSWPGAFSMAAVISFFAGHTNAIAFMRWFPFFIELSVLAPLLVIARYSGIGRRAAWLGIALYYSSNWILQDYFSPQALNFFFYLVIIATILACWEPVKMALTNEAPGSIRNRVRNSRMVFTRARVMGEHATTRWDTRASGGTFALLVLLGFASAISHQLTPYAMFVAGLALVLTRRFGRPEFVVLIGIFTLAWLSLGASNYWVGHLNAIFGSFGQFGNKLNNNVTDRVVGGTTHVLVVELRIVLTAGLYLLGGIGFLRRATNSRLLEALVGAPFLLLFAQDYGGEGLQRVVLYGLPFVAFLAASAFLPSQVGEIRSLVPNFSDVRITRYLYAALPVLIAATVFLFALSTTIVRGGNDSFESFSSGELAAANYVYDHIKPGGYLGLADFFALASQRDVGVNRTYTSPYYPPSEELRVAKSLYRHSPAYILLTKSQEEYGVQVQGYTPGWENEVQSILLRHDYKIVAHWSTATVLKQSVPQGTTVVGH